MDLTRTGLGIETPELNFFSDFDKVLSNLSYAESDIRNFGRGLASDLNIIETRQNFTENTINTFEAGADDLTLADQDEEAATVLALQTQQALQVTTLALTSQQSNIGNFLLQNPLQS